MLKLGMSSARPPYSLGIEDDEKAWGWRSYPCHLACHRVLRTRRLRRLWPRFDGGPRQAASSPCKHACLIARDIPTEAIDVRAPTCARRSLAKAAVRAARPQ